MAIVMHAPLKVDTADAESGARPTELESLRIALRERDLAIAALEKRVESLHQALRIASTPPIEPEATPEAPDHAPYPALLNVAVALNPNTLAPPGTPSTAPPSQRRAPRRICEVEVEFTEETHFYAGITQDISEGGLFIATYHLFAVGSRLTLAFQLPDGTQIKTLGHVRWLRGEVTEEHRPGMGVAFGDLTEAELCAIARYCEARPPLFMEL